MQARSRPEHIQEAIEGTLAVDWPALVARIAQPTLLLRAPGSFGPPGSPPILSREDAERTAAMMADCRLVDGVGNHLTFVFGDGGAGADRRHRGVSRRCDGVSGGYRLHVGGERRTMGAGMSDFRDLIGKELGPTGWLEVTQERIDAFADATGDHQWIHVDPVRAAEGPFGTTIAHGYLTLSLCAPLLAEAAGRPHRARR